MEKRRRIVIIGATSGIGYEVARLFCRQGWHVAIAGRRAERLEAFQKEICPDVVTGIVDVTANNAVEQLQQLTDRLGGMDLFLLCAGIGSQNRQLDAAIEEATVETNVKGFTRMVDAAWSYFRQHSGGHIAVISSIAGTKGLGAAPSYSASKRFQNTYIEALSQLARMERLPIFFTDIRPGFVKTDLLKDERYPLLMQPDQVARLIVKALMRKKKRVVIDWRYRLLVFFWRLIPDGLWERLPIHN